MKTYIVAVTVGVASLGIAQVKDTTLEFSQQSIELPALSLSGAAQQLLQSRLPDMTPRVSPMRQKIISNMPITRADEGIDAKVLIARPDATKDFKLELKSPQVESAEE